MFGHLACANSIERNPARVNLSPTMGTTSRVRLRGIKFTVLLRVKSVNETFIQSSRLNIIKIEIPKLKGGKKSSESALDESRIFGEKMKNSIRQLTFLFYTFHLSPRVLLSRIRPAKIMRIPSKSFLLSFLPIEFSSRSTFYTRVPKIRHRIFRFIRRPTPPPVSPNQILPSNRWNRWWFRELVQRGGAQRPFRDVPNVLAKNRRVCVYLGRVGSIDSART